MRSSRFNKKMVIRMKILITALIAVLMVFNAHAEEKKASSRDQVKTLTGMSVVGNDEAPKALYLVPWKSSQIGDEVSMEMRGQEYAPVIRDEFNRKVDYYYIQNEK